MLLSGLSSQEGGMKQSSRCRDETLGRQNKNVGERKES